MNILITVILLPIIAMIIYAIYNFLSTIICSIIDYLNIIHEYKYIDNETEYDIDENYDQYMEAKSQVVYGFVSLLFIFGLILTLIGSIIWLFMSY